MKVEFLGETFSILDSRASYTSPGHYRVDITLEYEGAQQTFGRTTTNMSAIDEWRDTDDPQHGDVILFNAVKYDLKREIEEFISQKN